LDTSYGFLDNDANVGNILTHINAKAEVAYTMRPIADISTSP